MEFNFGLQFENLVLANRLILCDRLGIEGIIQLGPYFQRPTKRHKGCQIDLLIQTKYRTLFVYEIKFSQHPIALAVVEEVKEKCSRLSRPRGFSIRTVLIHVNGVSDAVSDSEYFDDIVDFAALGKKTLT